MNSTFRSHSVQEKQQKGATLIVALVILLLITILGAATIRTATVEERMASSARNKDIALQAAEAALVTAEGVVEALTSTSNFNANCTNGLCTPLLSATNGERWENASLCSNKGIWDCGSVALATSIFTASDSIYAAPPRYFIELLTDFEPTGDNMNMYNYGSEITNTDITVFRITAIGYGGSTDAKVLLQSTYAKKF